MNEQAEAISNSTRLQTILYRVATMILIVGAFAGGATQLFRVEYITEIFIRLGYPLYLLNIIGIWKILAAIALIVPRFPLLKLWAYAGLFFVTSGAVISHAVSGHIVFIFAPLLVAVFTVISCTLYLKQHDINFAG